MAEFTEVMKQKERMCNSIKNCSSCKLKTCGTFMAEHPQEAEKIIMNWASENPIVTNAEKFKEVFGFEPENGCPISSELCYKEGIFTKCNVCNHHGFWNQEYKEPKEGE